MHEVFSSPQEWCWALKAIQHGGQTVLLYHMMSRGPKRAYIVKAAVRMGHIQSNNIWKFTRAIQSFFPHLKVKPEVSQLGQQCGSSGQFYTQQKLFELICHWATFLGVNGKWSTLTTYQAVNLLQLPNKKFLLGYFYLRCSKRKCTIAPSFESWQRRAKGYVFLCTTLWFHNVKHLNFMEGSFLTSWCVKWKLNMCQLSK